MLQMTFSNIFSEKIRLVVSCESSLFSANQQKKKKKKKKKKREWKENRLLQDGMALYGLIGEVSSCNWKDRNFVVFF